MNDLNTLLDRAAGPAFAPVDPHADLARGHRALARTRRRRRALGLAGVATMGVVGVGVGRALGGDDEARDDSTSVPVASSSPDPAVTVGPYTFPAPPEGWEVQGGYPQGVTIGRAGSSDQNPYAFEGKLVIGYDQNPPSGHKVQLDGETFWVGGGDYTSVARMSRAGEPSGEVMLQYPTATGWSTQTMIEFLAGVHVGPDARPGLG